MTQQGPESWTPERRGRALHMIWVLANTMPGAWRTKIEMWRGLEEFRDGHGERPQADRLENGETK